MATKDKSARKPHTFYFYFLRLREDEYGDLVEESVDTWSKADTCEIMPTVDMNDPEQAMMYGIEVGSFLATLGRVADYEWIDGYESGMTVHRSKPGIDNYPCNAKDLKPEKDIA